MTQSCPACGGRVVDALRLPGGQVHEVDDVPFGDGVQGVTSVRVCADCGDEVEVLDSR